MVRSNPMRQTGLTPEMTGPAHALPWADRARCVEVDPEIFFADHGQSGITAAARQVCRGCEVRGACLEHALADPGLQGVWGGLTARERQDLRRDRRIG